jgi:hypothetical protein
MMLLAAARPAEPDAGWGNLLALVVAAALFWAVVTLREQVWKPWRARRQALPASPSETLPAVSLGKDAGRGQLYVIKFSTGMVKIGKTAKGEARLDRHASDAAAFGATIVERWISPVHSGYGATEDALVLRCAAEAEQVKREYFRGLAFDRAVALAEAVIAERGVPGEGSTAPVGAVPAGVAPGLASYALARLLRRLQPAVAAPVEQPAAPMAPVTGWPVAPVPGAATVVLGSGNAYEAPPSPAGRPGPHGDALQRLLDTHSVDGQVTRFVRGPVSSRYEIAVQPGTKPETVTRLAAAMASACLTDRVDVALVPGRGTIGVEVANAEADPVLLGDVLAEAAGDAPLVLGLGRSIDGPVAPSMRKLPHLLVGGASGMGKSTLINACVCSLLRYPPERVGLVLIDPHQVELAPYANVPHLAVPIVTEARHAAGALLWVGHEMQRRSGLFVQYGVKNVEGYNRLVAEGTAEGPPLRYLVVVVDELAVLMTSARDDVEDPIVAIAESGLKYGAHLLLATQTPRAAVVTGRIKANVPGRLALTTTSGLESRIILDRDGAERLGGDGDALFLAPGYPLTRMRCALIDEAGVLAAVGRAGAKAGDLDQLRQAARLVVEVGYGSTSMLQTRMRLGWPAARRLIDELQSRGVLGPAEGNKARPVLVAAADLDDAMQTWV